VKIVVDTNIVFSAILNTNSRIAQVLIYQNPKFQFYSCDYLQTEILRHRDKLLKLTRLSADELTELESFITHNITFINEHLLPEQLVEETQIQLQNIDPFDVPFVALAKHLNAKLWTGDKKLYNPLKEQNFQNIISTLEMAVLIDGFED
jgi:predicted nucleic acid-binding protein